MICGCNQASVETVSSNTVMSSQVYQMYLIEADKSETRITATFRIGGATGTTLELTEPGNIFYNGAPLPKSAPENLLGSNYRMKGTDYRIFSKGYIPAHRFSFTDNDGKNYLNSINLVPIEISANPGFLFQFAQPATIPLSRAVGANETLTVAIDSVIDDEIPTSDNSAYLSPNRNALIITPQYWLAKSLKGKAELKIKIKKNSIISQGSPLGGSISAEYSAAPVSVAVNSAKKSRVDKKRSEGNVKSSDSTEIKFHKREKLNDK